ncbi:MAG TPA: hypothetical protein VJC20_00145 [Candidatus Paceibacterota bacterium]
MRRRVIYEPTISDVAVLILGALKKAGIESFWLHPYYHTFCKHTKRKSFYHSFKRLGERGLVVGVKQKNKKAEYILTEEGERLARRIKTKLAMSAHSKWDHKWRLLIFDIPEKIRGRRDFFRRELYNFGFYPLQKSVWVYPYHLPQDFFDIWDDLRIVDNFVIVETQNISCEERLLEHFFPSKS